MSADGKRRGDAQSYSLSFRDISLSHTMRFNLTHVRLRSSLIFHKHLQQQYFDGSILEPTSERIVQKTKVNQLTLWQYSNLSRSKTESGGTL
jgi:hypothetical protein